MPKYHTLKALVLGSLALACAPSVLAQTDTGATVVVKGDVKPRKSGEWVHAESTHFVVYSDRAQRDVSALLSKLERFDYVLRLYSGMTASKPQSKLELYYLASDQQIDKVSPEGPDYAIGLYRTCPDGSEALGVHMYYDPSPTATLDKQPENEGFIYIFQAYARHFFYQNSPQRLPVWFIEGYAEFFATARFEDNQAIVGMAAVNRARHLKLLGDGLRYKLNYQDIVLQNEREGIFDPRQYDVVSEYSSKSWLLTHYILSSKANLAKFRTYLAGGNVGQKPEAAFEQAFGFKISKLNSELSAYMRRDLQAVKMTFKTLPDGNISFQSLPAGIDNIVMARAALKACPDAAFGGKLLQSLRNTPVPRLSGALEDDLALLTRAQAEIAYGNPEAATPWLEAILKARPTQTEALYLKGKLDLALAQKADPASRSTLLARAANSFVKAGDADPTFAPGAFYWYRAQVMQAGKPNEDALAAGLLAWQMAPDVDAYAVHAGLIYAYLGKTAEAKAALNSVAANPLKGPMTVVARDWMARLGKGASADDILAALKSGFTEDNAARLQWTYAASDVLRDLRAKADVDMNGELPPVEPPQ